MFFCILPLNAPNPPITQVLRDEARATAVAYAELEEQRDKCVRERQMIESALARFRCEGVGCDVM